jgi:lipopolysaccharide transport system ATP-binding protein
MIAEYLAAVEDTLMGESSLTNHPGRPRSVRPLMTRVSLSGSAGGIASSYSIHDDLQIRVEFESPEQAFAPVLGYVLKDQLGAPLFSLDNRIVPGYAFPQSRGGAITCEIPALPLMPGRYSLDLYLGDHARSIDTVLDAVSFTVLEKDVYGMGRLPHAHTGPIIWSGSWRYEESNNGV